MGEAWMRVPHSHTASLLRIAEQSLSVDNLFVFVLVFNYFKTPPEGQQKVLAYGIGTAAVLRAFMILLGVELIQASAITCSDALPVISLQQTLPQFTLISVLPPPPPPLGADPLA